MKKYVLSFIIITLNFNLVCIAQSDKVVEENIIQPYPQYVHLSLRYLRYRAITQHFKAEFKNITTDKELSIKGTLVAHLVCGNEKTSDFNFTLEPGKTAGDGGFFDDPYNLIATVFDEDCKNPQKIYNDPNNKNYYEQNRIKSISLRGLIIKPIEDNNSSSPKPNVAVGGSVAIGSSSQAPATTSKANKNSTTKSPTQSSTTNNTASSSNYTTTKTDAQIKADADKEAHDKRVNDALNASKAADAAMGASAVGTIAIASTMKDKYQDGFAYMKFHLGLGWENIPIITNDDKNAKSQTDATSHPNIYLGFQTGIFNDKGISFHLKPYFSYGMNALSPGTTGSHISYGGVSTLLLGKYAHSKFKLFVEGGFIARSGNYSSDVDAAAASLGISTTSNIVQAADYNYSTMRYGGGIMIHLVNGDEETNIKPGIFLEKPSFFSSGTKPIMYANIEVLVSSFMIIEFGYSNKYAISGTGKYLGNFTKDDKDYFVIRLIKTGKIF